MLMCSSIQKLVLQMFTYCTIFVQYWRGKEYHSLEVRNPDIDI